MEGPAGIISLSVEYTRVTFLCYYVLFCLFYLLLFHYAMAYTATVYSVGREVD